jgi:hypothetical protein
LFGNIKKKKMGGGLGAHLGGEVTNRKKEKKFFLRKKNSWPR